MGWVVLSRGTQGNEAKLTRCLELLFDTAEAILSFLIGKGWIE